MDKRVKNVIIVDDTADNFGGTAQIAYITAVVLRDSGYNVVYFAGCGPIHSRLNGLGLLSQMRGRFSNRLIRFPVPLMGCTAVKLIRSFALY